MKPSRLPLTRTLFFPALIALLTGVGLIAGLLGDSLWDATAWLGLAVPLLPISWVLLRRTA